MSEKPLPAITDLNRDYFEGCALGELRLRRCLRCDARFRFAHSWCPRCWSADLGWDRAGGQGRVSHFSIVHQAPYEAFEDDAPYVIALVDLDEGVRMMTNIIGCDPRQVYVGMDVQVHFEPRGAVTLPMFRPTRRHAGEFPE